MSKLGIFSKMFGKWMPKSGGSKPYAQYQSMNGYTAVFRGFGDNAYESDVVRATVHAIATNAAKLKPRHIRRLDGEMRHPGNNVEKLLSLRPNPYMNAYDFFYKIVTQLYMRSNAFILIQSSGSRIVGFYPIVAQSAEALEYENELYLKFYFTGGKQLTVHYDEVIHLRRHYNESDIFGDSGDRPLLPTLELINTTNQGIMNAIKTSAFLRGILKFTAMLNPTDMKRQRDEFVKDYMDINNNGGVAATDSKMEYVKLDNTPLMVDSKQMDLIEKKVYKFFNVHEGIVTSKYDEDEWNAFYESVLEPLAVQMSLEFTCKVFTSNEQAHGNEIMFESNRLQYASNTTKTNIIMAMMDRGIMSMNEAREVFNMGPIEGGDKRIVSLNFVDADKANQYQVGEPDKPAGKEVDQENDDEDETKDG